MYTRHTIDRIRPWIALAASVGINLTMGINYSWSVIKKALVNELHWTNVEASLPYTTYAITFAFMMIFAGRMQDQYGPRKVVTSGGILLGIGLIACSFTINPLFMLLAYGITGFGNSLCYATTIPSSIKWFPPEKRGLVTGLVVGGLGVAAAYFSPIANWLLSSYGISRTFLILGLVIFCILITVAQFVRNPPDGYVPASSKGGQVVPSLQNIAQDIRWPEMLKTPIFKKLWFMYFGAAAAGVMIMSHIATIAKTQANWENGFYLVVVFALFNAGSRMVAGFLSDKYGRLKIMLVIFILQAINMIMFAFYGTPGLLSLGTALTGAAYGAVFALFPLATVDFFGIKNFGANYGLVFTAWGCAGICGPLVAGWAVDLTGQYVIAYIISAVLLGAAALLSLTIKPLQPSNNG